MSNVLTKAFSLFILSAVCLATPTNFGFARPLSHKLLEKKELRKPEMKLNRNNTHKPNFLIQYGYIKDPERASGSMGAMLQGRNPAAGAIP